MYMYREICTKQENFTRESTLELELLVFLRTLRLIDRLLSLDWLL